MNHCKKCESTNLDVGIANTLSGSTIFPIYCLDCGEVSTRYVKRQAAMLRAREIGPLKAVQTKTAARGIVRRCKVCDAEGAELHHWAPQHLFSDEAERWPTDYLCRPCHKKWHDLVTPNMSRRSTQ